MTPNWLSFYFSDFSDCLPRDWKSQVLNLVKSESKRTVLDGNSDTSSEKPGTLLQVRVVEGIPIEENLPWLAGMYEAEFLCFSAKSFGKDLFKCNEPNDAININCIEGPAARYEWHVDTNPVTGILYLDSFDEGDGGALIFRKKGEEFKFYPKSGWYCCFAAQGIEHSVESLRLADRRVSIPMNYYDDPNNTGRDPSLNSYLTKKL